MILYMIAQAGYVEIYADYVQELLAYSSHILQRCPERRSTVALLEL